MAGLGAGQLQAAAAPTGLGLYTWSWGSLSKNYSRSPLSMSHPSGLETSPKITGLFLPLQL